MEWNGNTMSKRRAEETYFNTELMPDYLEEKHEPGALNKDRFAMRRHALDATDIDDYDRMIKKWYGDDDQEGV